MIFVLFGIFLVIAITEGLLYKHIRKAESKLHKSVQNEAKGEAHQCVMIAGIFLSVVCVIAILMLLGAVINLQTYPSKISMYEQENTRIENSISVSVQNYMTFEKDTYASLSVSNMDTENIVALISLFPTLSSDKLVQSQIDTLVYNNQMVKELKESQISDRQYVWWLYFGSIT